MILNKRQKQCYTKNDSKSLGHRTSQKIKGTVLKVPLYKCRKLILPLKNCLN